MHRPSPQYLSHKQADYHKSQQDNNPIQSNSTFANINNPLQDKKNPPEPKSDISNTESNIYGIKGKGEVPDRAKKKCKRGEMQRGEYEEGRIPETARLGGADRRRRRSLRCSLL